MKDISGPQQDKHFPLIDLIRFGAALLVVFGHARGLLLVGIDSVGEPKIWVRGLYLISGLQHEGVVLFFVVSGYLVGGAAWQRMATGTFSAPDYLLSRFTRIYLVLIPSFVLVGIVSVLGSELFPATRFYQERPLFPSGVSDGWSWSQIPCHLFALQGLLCEPWGANPPLWSLGFEWTMYMAGPTLFAVMLLPMNRIARLVFCASALAIVVGLWRFNGGFIDWFTIWMLGVAASVLRQKFQIPVWIGAGAAVLCVAAMTVSRTKMLPLYTTDMLVAIGLSTALSCRAIAEVKFHARIVNRGARLSYSLYLIHLPICIFLGAMLESFFSWPSTLVQPDMRSIAVFSVMVAAAVLSSWLFARMTEDHTDFVRQRLSRRINRTSQSAVDEYQSLL